MRQIEGQIELLEYLLKTQMWPEETEDLFRRLLDELRCNQES